MPLIYFSRHGQTDWNVGQRMQGHLDIPLNDIGRRQAARNGAAIAEVIEDVSRFDFVSSPLVRASETMEIMRDAMGLELAGYRTDPRLREIHMGDWQGVHYPKLVHEYPAQFQAREADPWNFLYPGEGAESYAIFSARVLDWFSCITSDAIVTSHGGVMRCLRGHLLGLDRRDTVKLDVPQDKVLRIADGTLEWV
jgi:probable phosphoglycerate mutase